MWLKNIYKYTSAMVLLPCINLLCLSGKAVAQSQLPLSETIVSRRVMLVATLRNSNTNSSATLNSPNLLAQATFPSIPPGTIEPTTPVPPLLPKTLPTPAPSPQFEPRPAPTEPAPAIEAKIKVKKVEVLGSTVFSAEELTKVFALKG